MDSRNRLSHRVDGTSDTPSVVALSAAPSPLSGSASAATPPSPDVGPLSAPISAPVRNGLRMLLQAYEYAIDVAASPWEFAVEQPEMRSHGLTRTDLSWLVMKGWVEHGIETTLPGEARRSFRPVQGLRFLKRTGFVLTSAGVAAARRIVGESIVADSTECGASAPAAEAAGVASSAPRSATAARVVPHWDADLQELRVNGLIVKQFKVPAPNQEMVLAAFQEEGWPARIDDPLPPQADQDPKRRLHDTIVSLNRTHKHRLIRFMGDGSGEGVRWTIVTDQDE